MAFVIHGPRSEAIVEARDERLFYDLPRQFELVTPQCDLLWEAFYRDPRLGSSQQVQQFKSEIQAIRAAYRKVRSDALVKDKNIHAKDPRVIQQILEPMLAADQVLAKCDEIVAVCDEAIAAGEGLACSSD